jgi:hypothetical protein
MATGAFDPATAVVAKSNATTKETRVDDGSHQRGGKTACVRACVE